MMVLLEPKTVCPFRRFPDLQKIGVVLCGGALPGYWPDSFVVSCNLTPILKA